MTNQQAQFLILATMWKPFMEEIQKFWTEYFNYWQDFYGLSDGKMPCFDVASLSKVLQPYSSPTVH